MKSNVLKKCALAMFMSGLVCVASYSAQAMDATTCASALKASSLVKTCTYYSQCYGSPNCVSKNGVAVYNNDKANKRSVKILTCKRRDGSTHDFGTNGHNLKCNQIGESGDNTKGVRNCDGNVKVNVKTDEYGIDHCSSS